MYMYKTISSRKGLDQLNKPVTEVVVQTQLNFHQLYDLLETQYPNKQFCLDHNNDDIWVITFVGRMITFVDTI